jgi:non-specific serine/threonine protein kinase
MRQPTQSIQYFREALELRRSLGNTLGIAECLEGFGAAAAAQRQARRAARLLGAANALREITGAPLPATERKQFEGLVQRIQQQLNPEAFVREQAVGRGLGLEHAVDYALTRADSSDGTPRDAIESAPSALTQREHEVAVLVARGLTNKQIADALLLTRRTVGTHLEHIFAKLGVQARAEVAVWITRRSLVD